MWMSILPSRTKISGLLEIKPSRWDGYTWSSKYQTLEISHSAMPFHYPPVQALIPCAIYCCSRVGTILKWSHEYSPDANIHTHQSLNLSAFSSWLLPGPADAESPPSPHTLPKVEIAQPHAICMGLRSKDEMKCTELMTIRNMHTHTILHIAMFGMFGMWLYNLVLGTSPKEWVIKGNELSNYYTNPNDSMIILLTMSHRWWLLIAAHYHHHHCHCHCRWHRHCY